MPPYTDWREHVWTCWEISGSHYVLEWLEGYIARALISPN